MPDMGGCVPERNPDYAARQLVAVFYAMFGGVSNWAIVLWILGIALSVNLASSALYDALQGRHHWGQAFAVLLLLLFVVPLLWKGKWAFEHVCPVYIVDEEPKKCAALILFLSPNKDNLGPIQGDIAEPRLRERFTGPWRMPVEAVAYHVGKLRHVIVIPSGDSPGKEDGTYRIAHQFEDLIVRLAAGSRLEVVQVGQINPAWAEGVPFEKANDWLSAVRAAFDWLHQRGLRDRDIVVDITGGPKIATVAGAAVTIGEARRFQYVNTLDYTVLSFDLKYEARHA